MSHVTRYAFFRWGTARFSAVTIVGHVTCDTPPEALGKEGMAGQGC